MAFVSSFSGVRVGGEQRNTVSRRSGRVGVTRVTPKAQFNYNIYQDGNERSKRRVTGTDRAVTISKPLGLILEEGQDGMVFIASIDPNGNAAKGGQVQVGDIVVACSATFGDEVWSTRGVGLGKLMKSISVRSGPLVTLVLESPSQVAEKKQSSANLAMERRSEARSKFGERQVLDPNTWGTVPADKRPTSPPSESATFTPGATPTVEGYVEPVQQQNYVPKVSEEELKRQLLETEEESKESSPLLLYGSAGAAVGLILTIWLLSR